MIRRYVITALTVGTALFASSGTAFAAPPTNAMLRLQTGTLTLGTDGTGTTPALVTWTQGKSTTKGVGCCTNDISGSGAFAETTASSWPTTMHEGDGYGYEIDSYDARGTYVGTVFTDPPTYDDGFGLNGPSGFTFTGSWTTLSQPTAWGGTVAYSTRRGAAAHYHANDRAFELVMDKGPAFGQARITVTTAGKTTSTTINLHATTFRPRQIVLVRNYAEDPSEQESTITVTNLGTSGHSKVDVNAVGEVEID